MIITERIPIEKMQQFHEILCATGGRYLEEPYQLPNHMRVRYEPGNYKMQCEQWKRCITPIREVKKNQWWRVALRRCGINI